MQAGGSQSCRLGKAWIGQGTGVWADSSYACTAPSTTASFLFYQARGMIQTKAPQWKEQLEASRNPSNSHAQGLLAGSHSQGYPSGRLTPTHLEMVRSMWTAFAVLWRGCTAPYGLQGKDRFWPAWCLSMAFPGQDEGRVCTGCGGETCWVLLSERDGVSFV